MTRSGSGLLGSKIHRPQDILNLARETRDRCINIRNDILLSSKPKVIIEYFDTLSDHLCSILDVCEFLRNIHPKEDYVELANYSSVNLMEYMNTLNTDIELYKKLVQAIDNPEFQALPAETKQVAMVFKRDFEASGINLTYGTGRKFVSILTEIDSLGNTFQRNSASFDAKKIKFEDESWLNSVSKDMQTQFKSIQDRMRLGRKELPVVDSVVNSLLHYCEDQNIRKRIYGTAYSASSETLDVLDNLLIKRQELAELTGHKTYADATLRDKFFKKPDQLKSFLYEIASIVRPLADKEFNILRQLNGGKTVYHSDNAYLMNKFSLQNPVDATELNEVLSLSYCMDTLSNMFTKLYQVKLQWCDMERNESWHPSVKKVKVIHETEGLLGFIYIDFFQRRGKHNTPAHFVIRCGKEKGSHKYKENCVWNEPGLSKQLPVVVLSFNFHGESYNDYHCSLNDIEALFHEFGHAMHSMLSKTVFQNTSGTRCQMDFAEVPSTLNEFFATDERKYSNSAFDNIEKLVQIHHSILDLEYHRDWKQLRTNLVGSSQHPTSILYHKLLKEVTPFEPIESSDPQYKITHLFNYGCTYYSYLLCEGLSMTIWRKYFQRNPLDSNQGKRWREMVLSFGGSKDAYEMLREYLNEDPYDAMRNSWHDMVKEKSS
ncbi:zincin [Rozella allomycis CSF55]|uniref:mitochondrial intermediate peptidase n=1 Tax=Rozella allomycis (strain CSF55) TaxID=988480 RepID=A0A075AXI6_ROZAC|nr:Neurolysin/Thimet oligopeptidase 2 domain-containing protein [Rozella allomycis CSF55]RKP21030.1 zincin [Rozella allomycis CSF55]|eukprot:EPZ35020.1 Neurolysin/Thimet oligopeptidase 2 domain-containing protein [Rozella allomycis CSF55]